MGGWYFPEPVQKMSTCINKNVNGCSAEKEIIIKFKNNIAQKNGFVMQCILLETMNSAPGHWLPGALTGRCSSSRVMEFAEWSRLVGTAVGWVLRAAGTVMLFFFFSFVACVCA